jgi:hypothetical protein
MKSMPPVNPLRIAGQCIFLSMFCASLWYLLDVTAQRQAYSRACTDLKAQEKQLEKMESAAGRYRALKEHYLPCEQNGNTLVWQDIDVHFQDVDFKALTERLGFMYKNINRLYGGNSIFFVDKFIFEKKQAQKLPMASTDPAARSHKTDRIFTMEGRLLTPCATE